MAGEVVVSFLRPGTLLTAIPVILLFAFFALIIAFVPGLAGSGFDALIIVLVSAYVVGRFVQPARIGHLSEGFLSMHVDGKEARSYALRYVAAVILSGAPVLVGALWLTFKMLGDSAWGFGGMGMGSMLGAGLSGALVMLLIVLIMLDLVLSHLMAASTSEYSELMGLTPWLYLWERRADVLMFLVSAVGGIMAFWLIYFIPILVVIGLVSLVSEGAGFALMGWAAMLPAALSPILFGRLVGSFVAGYGEFDPEDRSIGDLSPEAAAALDAARSGATPEEVRAAAGQQQPSGPEPTSAESTAAPTITGATTTRTSVTVSAFTKDHVSAAVQSVSAMRDNDIEANREVAQTAFQNDPHDLAAAVRFGLLSIRAGHMDNAARALRLVIAELVAERSGAAAVELYLSLGKDRTKLALDKVTLEGLSRVLKLQGKFLDAGWCLYAAWIASNPQNAQNQLTMVGLEAVEKEAWEDVHRIFSFLLEKHPETSFKDQAAVALAKAESELALKRHKERGS
jgi:hypothetical protein